MGILSENHNVTCCRFGSIYMRTKNRLNIKAAFTGPLFFTHYLMERMFRLLLEKGIEMFVTIITVNGFKAYYGPFASASEAREAQMTLKAEAKRQYENNEIFSEVVKLEKF